VLRSVLAVIAAFVVSTVLVIAVELVSTTLFPPPPGLDPRDQEQLAAWISGLPVGALLLVGLAHALGGFGGGVTGARIGGKGPALVFAVVFALGTVVNLFTIPHPTWFAVYDVVCLIVGVSAGVALGLRWRASAPPAPAA